MVAVKISTFLVFTETIIVTVAKDKSVDAKASFVFMGDLNFHHREWLSSVRQADDR